eukprot:gnl/Chilomastix_caulleri/1431.p1 GENE.gnl/Chilomastix_caulleri/1431~~gnl/Chilomastix_caulleri/1431.p1  ORF type:complete len:79 (-),score=2.86 gnl/Chilomastix_caulleri/1431:184-420(-)
MANNRKARKFLGNTGSNFGNPQFQKFLFIFSKELCELWDCFGDEVLALQCLCTCLWNERIYNWLLFVDDIFKLYIMKI